MEVFHNYSSEKLDEGIAIVRLGCDTIRPPRQRLFECGPKGLGYLLSIEPTPISDPCPHLEIEGSLVGRMDWVIV